MREPEPPTPTGRRDQTPGWVALFAMLASFALVIGAAWWLVQQMLSL